MNSQTYKSEDEKTLAQINELRQFIESHEKIQALLDHSAAWADANTEASEKSRVTAWRIGIGASIGGLFALAVALTAVSTAFRPAPPPEVLVVDKTTGKVEKLISLTEFQETPEEATIRRNVSTFLKARENYSFDTAEDNYFDAAAFMSQPLQQQWAAYWEIGNPKSPLNVYKKDQKVRIEIGAITINRNDQNIPISARASFKRIIKKNEMAVGSPTTWIATIPFHWVNAPTKERDRRINDLGFEITDYQVDADIGSVAIPLAVPSSKPTPNVTTSQPTALTAPQATPETIVRENPQ